MPEFIYNFASIPLFIFLSCIFISISVITTTLVRRHIPLDFRYQENTAIVCCSALLGIIYAILIGFTILFELGAFDKAENSSNTEGRILYSIYHNTKNLPDIVASKIRTQVVKYINNVIDSEWPALSVGNKVDSKGVDIIENIQKDIRNYNLSTLNNKMDEALNSIAIATNTLYDLHQERTAHIHTTLNNHIWFVLLLASILTLGINYILGMEYRLHIVCVTLISIMISTIIFLIIGLNRPYQGDLSVQPKTFISTLEYISHDMPNTKK